MKFVKAERTDSFIKLAITGPSGSGKTYSALRLARGLVGANGRIAYIDTENQSAKLYSDLAEFFLLDLAAPFECRKFIEAVQEAEKAGFDCIVIDSLSDLWNWVLDYKSNLDRKGGNSFTNWNDAGKIFNEALQVILQSRIHVICCMRSKQEYILQTETNAKGKEVQVPKKIGTAPVMREGIDYEFSLCLEIGTDHSAFSSKDRTGLFDGKPAFRIDETTGEQIAGWLRNAPPAEPGNQEPANDTAETENFLQMIYEADSKESLGRIGLRIKESTLPESAKAIIRGAYREKFNALAAV